MVGAGLLLILWIIFTIKSLRKKDEPRACPGHLPFVGHALHLIGNEKALWKRLKTLENEVLKRGPLIVQIGWKKYYVVGDPESFQAITSSCFEKSELVHKYTKEVFGDSLINAKETVWRTHRKLVNPLFSQRIVDNHTRVFNNQAVIIVNEFNAVAGNGYFDVTPHLQRTTLRTICLTMAGVDIDEECYNQTQYVDAVKTTESSIIERVKRLWLYSDYLYSNSSLRNVYISSVKIMHSFIDKLILQRRKAFDAYKNGDKSVVMKRTLLDMILQLEDINMTNKEIRDEINSTVIAGYDTSAATLTYVLVMVGSHPDVQEKASAEIQNICPEGFIDRQTISRLKYMKAVIQETIRIVNIISFMPRFLNKNIKLKNCTLYKGHDCILLPKTLHRHYLWGDDAEEFKPERWLAQTNLDTLPFAGFGLGKRNCVGKNYALTYLAVMLVHILRRYKVSARYNDIVNYIGIVIKPISGHHISLENRT